MVSLPGDRTPYSGGAEGAPPVPPPGGYRNARRVPLPPPSGPPIGAPLVGGPRSRRPNLGGPLVLGAAGLFAFILLIMWAAGATSAIYGVAMLALQLALLIGVIAVILSPRGRGRRLGSIALAITLFVNVGTIGAASSVTRPPAAAVAADPEADHWAAYPGIQGQTAEEILDRASLEEVSRVGDEVLAAIRDRVSARFGYDWVRGVPGTTRAERNGYGGESMLVTYDSDNWATTQAITGYAQKLEVMAAVDDAILDLGFSDLYSLNDPANGFDPSVLENFYGSTDVRTQAVWEWVSADGAGLIRVYATLTDLSVDDGRFRATREGQVAGTGEPLEGLRISIYAPEVLSEADVDEFLDRMADYPF